VSRARAILAALAAAACLVSCGSASDGAALVHGSLFSGRAPWQTSMEFTGQAVVHGALPFRIEVSRPQPEAATGRGGLAAGLTIEIRTNLMPASGERLAVGAVEGPQATVKWIPPGDASPSSANDGNDVRWADGGFEIHAVGGMLEVDFDGRAPGDGAHGRFELTFQTGETVSGTFASALAD